MVLEGRAARLRPAFASATRPFMAPMSRLQVQATAAGRVDACIIWWELLMDQGGAIKISTAPDWVPAQPGSRGADQMPQGWRDHWKQCWTPVPSRPMAACGHSLQVDFAFVRCECTSHAQCNLSRTVQADLKRASLEMLPYTGAESALLQFRPLGTPWTIWFAVLLAGCSAA